MKQGKQILHQLLIFNIQRKRPKETNTDSLTQDISVLHSSKRKGREKSQEYWKEELDRGGRQPFHFACRQEFFERSADAAIRRLESALWVGVTERMPEATCLLFFTLGEEEMALGEHRVKQPRPVSVRSLDIR